MKSKYTIAITVFLTIMVSSGCWVDQPKVSEDLQESFQRLINVDDMNDSLRVSVDRANLQAFRFDTDIHVVIENLSDQQILIPEPEGIRLFMIRDNKWVKIDDATVYYGESRGPILYPAGPTELRNRTSTWIHPILKSGLEETTKLELLRIVIIGELMSDGRPTGIPVAAYTDVFISPQSTMTTP